MFYPKCVKNMNSLTFCTFKKDMGPSSVPNSYLNVQTEIKLVFKFTVFNY